MFQLFEDTSVRPEGWLREQLLLQAKGLSGNLDKMWPDIQDSAWIGGRHDSWERVPYWLDGFIPLAYLLDDADMKSRADFYINSILDRQTEDGWICPCPPEARKTYDLWAAFLVGKVLALYCGFTDSRRAKKGLYRAMKNLYELLAAGEISVFNWAKFRWFECFIPLLYLKRTCKEPWIAEFGRLLQKYGADYNTLTDRWKHPLNVWTMETHIVNITMALKAEAVTAALFDEKLTGDAEKLWAVLEKYNGTAVGTFTGDECLAGRHNTQGTELCSVAELMYSCEVLYAATGKRVWADRLEKAAFNALPATISDDMWTHQYDQTVNQIACARFPGRSLFRTNGPDSGMFGLEPGYGCCTANFNQAWPKLAMNVFHRVRGGFVSSLPLPATLRTKYNGTEVEIRQESDYPFRHTCTYTVKVDKPTDFVLKMRLPAWAEAVEVDGKPVARAAYLTLGKSWVGEKTVSVRLLAKPRFCERPYGAHKLYTADYGPLVFALPLVADWKPEEYERDGVIRKFPYCDYTVTTKDEWRYGFADSSLTPAEHKGDEYPFSSRAPRLTLRANLIRVDWDWKEGFDNVPALHPDTNAALSGAAPEVKELYPYGAAKLRITEMPKVSKK